MTILEENFTLNNKVKIPKLGFGTWLIANDAAEWVVQEAVKAGYRHFDTAQAYDNEVGVGKGLKKAMLTREELFITSKVRAEYKDYKQTKVSIDESLKNLGIDYLDLLLIHAPEPWDQFHGTNHYFAGNLETWRAMEDALKEGKIRAIGVSNFEEADLSNILQNCTVKPAVNQLLVHIANTPFDLINYTQKQGILVEAYSPIGHGEILRNQNLKKMAVKYHVSVAQLGIRYCLQLGTLPLPKSVKAAHLRSNVQVDFEISAADMLTLKKMPHIKDYGKAAGFPVYGGHQRK